jgi:hypothetical protein
MTTIENRSARQDWTSLARIPIATRLTEMAAVRRIAGALRRPGVLTTHPLRGGVNRGPDDGLDPHRGGPRDTADGDIGDELAWRAA